VHLAAKALKLLQELPFALLSLRQLRTQKVGALCSTRTLRLELTLACLQRSPQPVLAQGRRLLGGPRLGCGRRGSVLPSLGICLWGHAARGSQWQLAVAAACSAESHRRLRLCLRLRPRLGLQLGRWLRLRRLPLRRLLQSWLRLLQRQRP